MQILLASLAGYETETARLRLQALQAHEQAVLAISRLDQAVFRHPYATLWRAYSEVYALAELGLQIGEPCDEKRIFSAIARAETTVLEPALGHQTQAVRNRWRAMEWRKGHEALKETVEALCAVNPAQGPALLLLADRLHQLESQRLDRGDLAMAVPHALRRLKLTRSVLPGLMGSVRAVASREYGPTAMFERFCLRLAEQAEQGLRLLEDISRAAAESQRKVEGAKTQRKGALRRLAWEALWPRPLSPAGLARRWHQQVSTTSRLLKSGEEIGIVQTVADRSAMKRPIYQRYAGPLLMQLAGLEPVPRGRPALPPHPASLPPMLDPMFDDAAFSDALAAVDRMLERLGTPALAEED